MKTEDASKRLHLSLVNSVKDYDNPNPGTYTYNEQALGKGTWVVIINSGYNWEQFPEEYGRPDDPRPLRVWRVPYRIRNRTLEQQEVQDGHWAPDDDLDYADPFEGVPEGHGTQTAMLAAGRRLGVAKDAGLYLIKAGGAILDKEGEVVDEDTCIESLLVSLFHVIEKLQDGTLVNGKTVVVIDTIWKIENVQNDKNIGKKGYQHFYDSIAQALEELDSLGAVVTISAGNDGQHDPPGLTDAYIPNILAAQPNSPLIIVGAVNSQGQLARISCPGSARIPINCYAMGKGIKVVDLSVEEVTEQDGTTFSVAIVGGLAASYLSDPAFSEYFKWAPDDPRGDTVGNRMKDWLSTEGQGSYQRVEDGNMLDEPKSRWRNHPIPDRVNTAYNYGHGSQGGEGEMEL